MNSTGRQAGRIAEPNAVRNVRVPRAARSFAGLLAAGLLVTARPATADEPEREVRHDPTAFPAPSTRLPLFAIGAATSLVWYGAAVGGAYLYPTANGADELKIPIAGPWMSLAETGCPSTTPDCSTFWMVVGGILKGFSGIGQAGGVLLMVESLFLPTVESRPATARTRWNLSPRAHELDHVSSATPAATSVVVLPAPLPGGAGVSVLGLF